MDNITTTHEDLLEEEQKDKTSNITSCTGTSAPDSKLGFKALSSSSSSPPPPSSLDLEKRNSAPAGISKSKDLHFMLAQIRTQYLQARPPQQIKELRSLLEKIIGSQEGVLIRTTTSTGDQDEVGNGGGGASTAAVDLSSNGKKCTSCSSNTCYPNAGKVLGRDDGGGMKGDLDEVGNKTEEDGKVCGNKITTTTDTTKTTASCGEVRRKVGGNGTVGEDEREYASSSITHEEEEDMQDEILIGLHDLTIGYNPPPSLAAEGEQTLLEVNPEKATEHGSFLHPPIHYRLSFAKYIIKQVSTLYLTYMHVSLQLF